MGKALIITEKPSVAGDISRVLGRFTKEKDYYENDDFVISHAVGHLLELKVPDGVEVKRGKWTLAALPVLPNTFDLEPVEKTESQLKVLLRLLKRKDIDSVVNACDAGREGELIFRNILRYGAEKTASIAKLPVKRLWLQSMTPQAIRDAFTRLRSDEEMQPLSSAALSRAESDWLVGINSTRAFTAFNNKLIGGFQKTTAGRVQTPTLAILVEREVKIRAFQARSYFEVFGDFGIESGSYRGRWFDESFKKGTDEDAKAERIWTRESADAVVARCTGGIGIVEEERKPTTQAPPLLYDLTTLQREANQRFGLSAGRTLQIAQALYERHKVLTYPRTDSRYLPEDYIGTVKGVLGKIDEPGLQNHAQTALNSGWVRPNKRIFNNAKVSDHFAIVPTGQDPKSLDDFQRRIYEMVLKRFIAVFFPPAQFEVTTRITRVGQDAFKTDGKVIKDPGWMAVYGREAENEGNSDKTIAPCREGEQAQVEALEVSENITKPPARYNEGTLLSAMEGAGKLVDDEELREAMSERGLGTPATRASVIEGLIKQEYIHRRGKELVPSAKGISLITLLKNLGAEVLTKPEMTGEWEFKLNRMEDGHLSRTEFMDGIRNLTTQIVEKVKGFGSTEIEGQYQTLDVACPACKGGPFKEDYRSWTCANCSLKIWKNLAGREFEPDEIRTLLTERKVGPIDGFISRQGRRFAADVVLDEQNKPTFSFASSEADSTEPPDLSGFPRVGKCPVCKEGEVLETETQWACEHSMDGSKACTFRMGRKILQRDISRDQLDKMMAAGKTDLIPGFISKKGRPFKAFLVLKDGKVGFEFEERKGPPRAAKGAAAKAGGKTVRKGSKKPANHEGPGDSEGSEAA